MQALSSLQTGLIKGRWKVVRKIGQGAFGEIFQGRNVVTNEDVAIKVERIDSKKQVLKLEVAVLKKLQPCDHVVPFVTCGKHGDYNYLVMQLLGENLSELRRRQASGRFSVVTCGLLALQMIASIKAVHQMGYLHRDIKPSNFAMGMGAKKSTVFVIDFGLSRRYVLPSGKVRPAREQSGFRGTARYASINAHLAKDLARRDDLWSLLYMLIEFANGVLPWRRLKDKDLVGEMKIRCNTPELVADLPVEFFTLWEHLQALRYEDEPDYDMLTAAFKQMVATAGGSCDNVVFDWDGSAHSFGSHARSLPRLADLCARAVVGQLDGPKFELPSKVPQALRAQLTTLALRMTPKLSERAMMRLLDASTLAVDFAALGGEEPLPPALFASALRTASGARRLTLGEVSDARLADVIKSSNALESVALVAVEKAVTVKKGVRPLVEHFSSTLSSVALTGDGVIDDMAEAVIKYCPQLASLSLDGCRRVKGTSLAPLAKGKSGQQLRSLNMSDCEFSKSGFKLLVKSCASLTSLQLLPLTAAFSVSAADVVQLVHRGTGLRTLGVRNHDFELDSLLVAVAAHAPQLEQLTVHGMGVTDFGVGQLVGACSGLRRLSLQCGDGITDASLTRFSSCTALTSLRLQFSSRSRSLVSEGALRGLLGSVAEMEELWLQGCTLTLHTFPEEGLFFGIQRLNVAECAQVDDVVLDRMAQLCPNLRELDLSGLNELTSAGLTHLSVWCGVLEDLILLNCVCFEDEGLLATLASLPLLRMHVTRFPSPSLRPVEIWLRRGSAEDALRTVPNSNRLLALEKRRLYSNVP